jgi:tRNA (cmo5U34)-methyltransferase
MNVGDWTFQSADIARDFDAHVREQLPWYELATGAVAHIARHYIPRNGLVYDIGASTGNIGRALSETLTQREARLIAIEQSAQMVAAYEGPGEVIHADATGFDFAPYDVAVAFLFLMFVPSGYRRALLQTLCAKIRPGGALIIFDKTEGRGGYLSTVLHRLTIAGKVAQGTPAGEIIAKELSLIGVQRPISDAFMSLYAVPSAVEVFRFGEFAGWVIERPE